jgi:hypothetical protein
MQSLIGLLTLLVFCLGLTVPSWAQREVKPPASTPLDGKPALGPPVQASTLPTVTAKPEPAAKKPPEQANQATKPAPAQTAADPKKTPKTVSAAKGQPEKANQTAKTAPVQASVVPGAGEAKKPAKTGPAATTRPGKASKTARQAETGEGMTKPKTKKVPKICQTKPGQEPAPAKKAATKVADKPTQKRVFRATTIPTQ